MEAVKDFYLLNIFVYEVGLILQGKMFEECLVRSTCKLCARNKYVNKNLTRDKSLARIMLTYK